MLITFQVVPSIYFRHNSLPNMGTQIKRKHNASNYGITQFSNGDLRGNSLKLFGSGTTDLSQTWCLFQVLNLSRVLSPCRYPSRCRIFEASIPNVIEDYDSENSERDNSPSDTESIISIIRKGEGTRDENLSEFMTMRNSSANVSNVTVPDDTPDENELVQTID